MIRRINKLKNVGRFTELRSGSGNQHAFDQVNIIYASNGSGKTTLCDLFRSIGTGRLDYIRGRKTFGSTAPIEIEILLQGTPSRTLTYGQSSWRVDPLAPLPRTFVYDDRFVADNVFIGQAIAVDQRRNLYGLVLGARGQELKAVVETAEDDLSHATPNLNAAKLTLNALLPPGFTIDSFRPLTADALIDQHILEAESALDAARRAQKNVDAIRQRRPLAPFSPATIPTDLVAGLATTLDSAALEAESHIKEHLAQHTQGLHLEWIAQGHRAQLGTTCPNCGQDMAALDLLAAYRAYFSGALQEQQNQQRRLLQEAESRFGPMARQSAQRLLESHRNEQSWWHDAGGLAFDLSSSPSANDVDVAMQAVHTALIDVLKRKQAQPGQACLLTDMESAAFARWNEIATALVGYSATLVPINESITQRQRSAGTVDLGALEKQISALKAQKTRHDPSVIEAYRIFDEATSKKAEKERAKTNANRALKEESELVLRTYGNRINTLLENFGANFRIVSDGVNFLGGPPAGQLTIEISGTRISSSPDDARNPAIPSLANTLSGGDRSALGLAFFIAVAEHDPQIGSSIVVLDDPFHSQDRSRRQRTLECVELMAGVSLQTFVFSHELDFSLAAASLVGAPVKIFSLDTLTTPATITEGNLPQLPAHAFQEDYRLLADFLETPGHYATRLKDIARSIRQVLETYMRVKFPREWRRDEWLGGMIEQLRDATPGNILHHCQHLVPDLTRVNNWGKRYYHSETDGSAAAVLDATELKSYVEQTIRIISR
jgi:wobble nucleotide-excising tRNase